MGFRAFAFAWLALGLLGSARAADRVHLEQRSPCLEAAALYQRLGPLLERFDPEAHLALTVVVDPAVEGHAVSLRLIVVKTGALALDRSLHLGPGDCPSGLALIAVVLERFLEDFPIHEWIPPPPEPRVEEVVVTRDVVELAGQVFVAADSRWTEPSADLELGLALDVGSSRHRLIGSVAVRVGLPTELGSGRFVESLGLLGVGWRYADRRWMIRTEVRTGGLLVTGFGYDRNYHRWMLWLEGQVAFLWDLGGVLLGGQVAASPLWHTVSTTAGQEAEIPWLRVGLVIGFPFWYETF